MSMLSIITTVATIVSAVFAACKADVESLKLFHKKPRWSKKLPFAQQTVIALVVFLVLSLTCIVLNDYIKHSLTVSGGILFFLDILSAFAIVFMFLALLELVPLLFSVTTVPQLCEKCRAFRLRRTLGKKGYEYKKNWVGKNFQDARLFRCPARYFFGLTLDIAMSTSR